VPTITKFSPQSRHPEILNVFLDSKYCFGLSELEVSVAGLTIGQELSDKEVAKLTLQSEFDKAYNQAIFYLSFRPRSQYETHTYLAKKDYSSKAIELVLQKLEDKQLVDDYKFAVSWVESRNLTKPSSKQKLIAELRQKKIDRTIIDKVMNTIDEEVEIEIITGIIAKKQRQLKYHDSEKLIAYLLRQGFSYNKIKKALGK